MTVETRWAVGMVFLLLLLFPSVSTAAPETLSGPIPVETPVAIDGDSFRGWAVLLPGHRVEVTVRIRGIDAPELHGTCQNERAAALAAKAALAQLLNNGSFFLTEVSADKYYGRVVAQVRDGEGHDIGQRLLTAGHARPYDGGKRTGWCAAR